MKKKTSSYVTRSEIEAKFEKSFKAFEFRMGIVFDNLERKILDQVVNIRDQILTSNDNVVKELENIRTNYQVFRGISEEVREKVEDHEKRIGKLEGN